MIKHDDVFVYELSVLSAQNNSMFRVPASLITLLDGVKHRVKTSEQVLVNLKPSFQSLSSTMYWVYYLVWANELNEALREMTEPYSPRTDDNRFVEQKLERVGMIR